jgi:hypothetical protein
MLPGTYCLGGRVSSSPRRELGGVAAGCTGEGRKKWVGRHGTVGL